jgi:hypothetical protein
MRGTTDDRKLELDVGVFRRSNNALTKALAGGKHLGAFLEMPVTLRG